MKSSPPQQDAIHGKGLNRRLLSPWTSTLPLSYTAILVFNMRDSSIFCLDESISIYGGSKTNETTFVRDINVSTCLVKFSDDLPTSNISSTVLERLGLSYYLFIALYKRYVHVDKRLMFSDFANTKSYSFGTSFCWNQAGIYFPIYCNR